LGIAVYQDDTKKGTYKAADVAAESNIPGSYHATKSQGVQVSGLMRENGQYTVSKSKEENMVYIKA